MIRIAEKPTIAPGPYGKPIEIKPYTRWPLPYRGSKYSLVERIIGGKRRWIVVWKYMDIAPIYNKDEDGNPKLPENLLLSFRKIGKSSGSFRITPNKEVITKVLNREGKWVTYYLGKLEGQWNFGNNIDLDPKIRPFSLWTGFTFHHGEYWSVWIRERSGSKLYWKYRIDYSNKFLPIVQHIYFNSVEDYPDLVRIYLEIRPHGGRLYINEYGHIWMNLPNSEVGPTYEDEIKSNIESLLDGTFEGNGRLIYKRFKETQCWPIYIGNIKDYDLGNPPRTYFEDLSHYFENISRNEEIESEEIDRNIGM